MDPVYIEIVGLASGVDIRTGQKTFAVQLRTGATDDAQSVVSASVSEDAFTRISDLIMGQKESPEGGPTPSKTAATPRAKVVVPKIVAQPKVDEDPYGDPDGGTSA